MTSKNSYINNPESVGELTRLIKQATLLEECTGVLPRVFADDLFEKILDIGCGPGNWVITMAHRYPEATVVGLDVSESMIRYARTRASVQRLENARFEVCDALDRQEVPLQKDDYDLIRLALASSWVLDWDAVLKQGWKMLKPGGVLVVTEGELALTTAQALNRLQTIILNAFKKSERSGSVGKNFGVTTQLGRMLREAGFQQVGIEVNAFDFSYYNEMENRAWRDMIPILLNEIKPFLLSQGVTTEEELVDVEFGCLTGMYEEDFCGIAPIYTFIGIKDE